MIPTKIKLALFQEDIKNYSTFTANAIQEAILWLLVEINTASIK